MNVDPSIDGSYGEGGGLILRTAVSLSVIMGKSVEIISIRLNRSRPGLRPQHVVAIKTIAELFYATVENLKVW